jgi:hypothetical protein
VILGRHSAGAPANEDGELHEGTVDAVAVVAAPVVAAGSGCGLVVGRGSDCNGRIPVYEVRVRRDLAATAADDDMDPVDFEEDIRMEDTDFEVVVAGKVASKVASNCDCSCETTWLTKVGGDSCGGVGREPHPVLLSREWRKKHRLGQTTTGFCSRLCFGGSFSLGRCRRWFGSFRQKMLREKQVLALEGDVVTVSQRPTRCGR